MIYLDTSVALAHLLAEDRMPPEHLWREDLISSRLLEYEIWTRIHPRKLTRSHADEVRSLLGRVALVELSPPRCLPEPWSFSPSRFAPWTPLHLASIEFLRKQGQNVSVAVYDGRLLDAVRALRFPLYKL